MSRHCIRMFLHLTLNSGFTYGVFLKILKSRATFISGQGIPVRLMTMSQLETMAYV